MTAFHFVRASGNRKTGAIPVTMTTRDSCPDSCSLKGSGCYAESGQIGMHWGAFEKGRNALTLVELCRMIRTIPSGAYWRHNVAGDLPGQGETIDAAALLKIARANRGRRGFTYTHKHTSPANLEAINQAMAKGFTINLSADNSTQADDLMARGLPVVTIIESESPKVSFTPCGNKIVQCPAENSVRITCANCGLCALPERPYIIGFSPKGNKIKQINRRINHAKLKS